MVYVIIFLIFLAIVAITFNRWDSQLKHKSHNHNKNENIYSDVWKQKNEKVKRDNWHKLFQSPSEQRRDYYNNEYLKSDAWQRKRYVVFKRDNWRCVHCGARATQVHHKKYARKNIGKEPIEWLESVCKDCHERLHGNKLY